MKEISFETVSIASYCFQENRREVLIESSEVLKRVWQDAFESKPLPKVDFDNQCLIGVFYGKRQVSGYGLAIHSLTDEGHRVVVRIKLTRPESLGENRVSQPYHVVKCQAIKKQVVFKYLN